MGKYSVVPESVSIILPSTVYALFGGLFGHILAAQKIQSAPGAILSPAHVLHIQTHTHGAIAGFQNVQKVVGIGGRAEVTSQVTSQVTSHGSIISSIPPTWAT